GYGDVPVFDFANSALEWGTGLVYDNTNGLQSQFGFVGTGAGAAVFQSLTGSATLLGFNGNVVIGTNELVLGNDIISTNETVSNILNLANGLLQINSTNA